MLPPALAKLTRGSPMSKPTRPQPCPISREKPLNQLPPRQPQTPPPYRPQATPRCLQPKAAAQKPSRGRVNAPAPTVPPKYQPQPAPKVLQKKATTTQPRFSAGRPGPSSPPIYRPQPAPKCMQRQTVDGQRPPVTHPASRPPSSLKNEFVLGRPLPAGPRPARPTLQMKAAPAVCSQGIPARPVTPSPVRRPVIQRMESGSNINSSSNSNSSSNNNNNNNNQGGQSINAMSFDLFESMNVRPLMNYLDQKAGRGNWAFAGSFAMYIWARWANSEARVPDDVDVVVKSAHWNDVAYDLNFRDDVHKISRYPAKPGNDEPIFECRLKTGVKLDLHTYNFNDNEVARYGRQSDIPVLTTAPLKQKLGMRAANTSDPKSPQAENDLDRLTKIEQDYRDKYKP